MNFLLNASKFVIKFIFHKTDYRWLFRLWDFSLKENKFYFHLSMIFMIIEVIFDTFEPYALGKLTKLLIIKEQNISNLTNIIFKIIFILFSNRFFEKLKDRFGNLFNSNFEKNLQREYYIRLLEKDCEFFDKNKISTIFSVLSNDITIIGDITVFGFINLIKQLIQSLICIIILFFISKNLCLIICIFVPIIALINSFKKNFILKKESENEKNENNSNNVVLEAFENIKVVKSFSTENKERNKYENNLNRLFYNEKNIIYTCTIFETIMILMLNLIIFISVNYTIYLTKGNPIGIDSFASFFLYCKIIYNGFFNISKFNRNFLRASVLAEKLFTIYDYKPKIKTYQAYSDKNISNNSIKRNISGNIELKNVNFEYSDINKIKKSGILKNINLNIKSGMSLGIVGLSGGGKSTLINLIQRLYDIDIDDKNKEEIEIIKKNFIDDEEKVKLLELTGDNVNNKSIVENKNGVFYDDINIKNYDLKYLHSQIGYVQQEPSLFNGTIKENIIYGLDNSIEIDYSNLNQIDIKKAVELAQGNFVFDKEKFPLGLDTNVGERGSKLSGGQKQRISIARALIKNPKILILDEATSALDSESEFNFKKELDKLKGKMTIIIISHRLSTIKDCDQIIVINKGEIVEKGRHEELLKMKGIYYSLMEKQI